MRSTPSTLQSQFWPLPILSEPLESVHSKPFPDIKDEDHEAEREGAEPVGCAAKSVARRGQTEQSAQRERKRSMHFGTVIDDDKVGFRLWAPAAKKVDLLLSAPEQQVALPMISKGDGWYHLESDATRVGDMYQFRINGELAVPDPASRFQPNDVHGASEIIDPDAFDWKDASWIGRPWQEVVLYELNVGTFSPEGTFKGVEERLDKLVELGITALELMPVADFPGRWGWGYDGVLPYAPESNYGRPEDLKSLVQAAHARNLMIFIDVVYNHFGPEGNYLHAYAKQFFTEKHQTPWGAAINYDDKHSEIVRSFFIENALYWLEEYHMDGLRLDAVHAIKDDSSKNVLEELAERVAAGPGSERKIYLVLENEENCATLLKRDDNGKPIHYTAQWNDDVHHAYHVLATGETNGYYADYNAEVSKRTPIQHLGRCLTEGFSYQGDPTPFRNGGGRGEKSKHLPPTAFITFIQNHDQIGNRAFGDRIASLTSPEALRAITSIYLLAPGIPMLFMGEEWGSKTPFCYFCDVGPDLAPLVTEGRRKEFAKFPEFSNPETRERIPDPCDESTFTSSKLDWQEAERPENAAVLGLYKQLLTLRRQEVVPLLSQPVSSGYTTKDRGAIFAWWQFGESRNAGSSTLALVANLHNEQIELTSANGNLLEASKKPMLQQCRPIFQSSNYSNWSPDCKSLPAWSVVWLKSQ